MEKSSNQSLVFWAACAGMLLFGISFITLGSVTVPLRAKFELDDVASGTLFAILPVGIITGSLLFGPVADRYGYKWLLVISCIALFGGFMGIAHAGSLALLKVAVYFFGVGGGGINGSTNAVVAIISERNKVSNLSLLGVCYGLGALGMPFVLGSVQGQIPYERIVDVVAFLTLAVCGLFILIRFPPPQQVKPFSFRAVSKIFDKRIMGLIAAFLFLQMSLEAIVNNWTANFLHAHHGITESNALFGLSLYVGGMTVMRILIGSVFRSFSEQRLLGMSLALLFAGSLTLLFQGPFWVLVTGLVALGAGMSAGIPLMLGMVGGLYKDMAGTAFSAVIVIGLLGNLVVNYLMGYLVKHLGIAYFGYGLLVEWLLMLVVGMLIIHLLNTKTNLNNS